MINLFNNKAIHFTVFCIFILLLNVPLQSQKKIYRLHAVVGDTIDSHEMSHFLLFTDFQDKDVDYWMLFVDNNQFELHGFKGNDLQFDSVVSEAEVLKNAQNIDKLNAYFLLKEEKDSIVLPPLELEDLPVVEIKVDKDKLNKEIKQMNKQKNRREWDNDRHERVRKGMHMF